MREPRPDGRSVAGCAFGFGWAGLGAGPLLWLLTSRSLPVVDELSDEHFLTVQYFGTIMAMFAGAAVGAPFGVLYARNLQRVDA